MARLPRLAVGTIQAETDSQAVVWALMEALCRLGIQVQSYVSRACFPAYQGAVAVTGLAPRHLDSWLMSPDRCRDLFARGARAADVAIVEGTFAGPDDPPSRGGQLEPLCEWLDLARVAVIDASRIDGCRIPPRPPGVDGLLLDRIADDGHLARLSTDLEALWGVPVLGAVDRLPRLRAELAALPRGSRPSEHLYQPLGDSFLRHWRPERFWPLVSRRRGPPATWRRFRPSPHSARMTVAIAYDEGFHCYFPDALDLLESLGARVLDFSPLRDEGLPPKTDVVYLGCGHPERFAGMLEENHCMKAALRSHVRAGRRIYAEGAAAAYLCQYLQTPDGRRRRMVGILPAIARATPTPAEPVPVEVTLARPNWLAGAGARLRGYQNRDWRIEPIDPAAGLVAEAGLERSLIGGLHAVGSLVHLNFAAQPSSLAQFFCPPAPQSAMPDPWPVTP